MIFFEHKELAALVIKARNGDSQAFHQIYEHTAPVQYHYLRQIMDDPSDAQDALQEIYFLLYQNLEKIHSPGALVAYLNRLSFNVGKNVSRSTGKFHNRIVEIDEASQVADPTLSVTDGIEKREKREMVRKALEELPDQERRILVQRYYQKQTLSQIAYAMDTSLSTVKRLQRLGKKHLKEALEWRDGIFAGLFLPGLIRSAEQIAENTVCPPFKELPGNTFPANESAPAPPASQYSAVSVAGTVAVKSALTMAALAAAAAVCSAAVPAPSVEKIELPKDYTAAPAEVTISIESMLPLRNVKLTSPSGENLKVIDAGAGRFKAGAVKNGAYTFTASAVNGKSVSKTFQVDKIDRKPPRLVSVNQHEGRITVAVFEDDETGINYDSLYCEAEDGTITLPGSVDKKMKSAAFCLPKKNNVLHFADLAGNACTSELEFSRDRKK